jgi:hypothetical protein
MQVVLRELRLGPLVVSEIDVVLLDMSHVNESYLRLGLPALDGVLGSDLLHRYNAVIDYESAVLRLKKKPGGLPRSAGR